MDPILCDDSASLHGTGLLLTIKIRPASSVSTRQFGRLLNTSVISFIFCSTILFILLSHPFQFIYHLLIMQFLLDKILPLALRRFNDPLTDILSCTHDLSMVQLPTLSTYCYSQQLANASIRATGFTSQRTTRSTNNLYR